RSRALHRAADRPRAWRNDLGRLFEREGHRLYGRAPPAATSRFGRLTPPKHPRLEVVEAWGMKSLCSLSLIPLALSACASSTTPAPPPTEPDPPIHLHPHPEIPPDEPW